MRVRRSYDAPVSHEIADDSGQDDEISGDRNIAGGENEEEGEGEEGQDDGDGATTPERLLADDGNFFDFKKF